MARGHMLAGGDKLDWFVRLHWLDREVRQLHGLVAALHEYVSDIGTARIRVDDGTSNEFLRAYA